MDKGRDPQDIGKLHQGEMPAQLRPMTADERIDEIFAYKQTNSEQNTKSMNIRLAAASFAKTVAHNLYGSQHSERAIRKIHEISMLCNWAISRER